MEIVSPDNCQESFLRVTKLPKPSDSRTVAHLATQTYLCESHLECHRGHLKLDNYYVKVLILKEPSAQSFPLIFKHLLEAQAMGIFRCIQLITNENNLWD